MFFSLFSRSLSLSTKWFMLMTLFDLDHILKLLIFIIATHETERDSIETCNQLIFNFILVFAFFCPSKVHCSILFNFVQLRWLRAHVQVEFLLSNLSFFFFWFYFRQQKLAVSINKLIFQVLEDWWCAKVSTLTVDECNELFHWWSDWFFLFVCFFFLQ